MSLYTPTANIQARPRRRRRQGAVSIAQTTSPGQHIALPGVECYSVPAGERESDVGNAGQPGLIRGPVRVRSPVDVRRQVSYDGRYEMPSEEAEPTGAF